MVSIYFDKDEYRAGETARITYEDAPGRSLAAVRRGGLIIHRKALVSGGSGSFDYKVPTTLGEYEVVLFDFRGSVIAHDTMYVVTGAAPPPGKGTLKVNTSPTGAGVRVGAVSCGTTPVTACELSPGGKEIILTKTGYKERVLMEEIKAGQTTNLGTITLTPTAALPAEGETRELELGEYEVTWTLSGCDTLNAEIRVTDTGVTCLSVTAGACNSSTAPGVTISTFTVTGHLKSAVAPPAEMTKSEFLTEIQNRGEVDLSKITTSPGWNKWVKKGYAGYWRIDYSDGTKYLIEIWNMHARNPPTRESDIHFHDIRPATPIPISKIETAWALARINALPFVGVAPPVGLGGWIDESGVTNLTPSHAVYVYYLSQGATGAADTKYAGLSPKPSRLDVSLATVNNAIGIFYYSQGAMGAGNSKTGLNY